MRQSARQLKLGLIQYPIQEKQSEERLLQKHRVFFADAKKARVDLLLFPELVCLDLVDFTLPLAPQWDRLSEFHNEIYLPQMKLLSEEFQMDVLTGSFPDRRDDKIFNTCWLIEKNQPLLRVDKAFVTPEEHHEYQWSSGQNLQAFEYRGIKTVILICHDSEFPQCSNLIAKYQPELLIIPSMTTDQWGLNRVRWSTQARCVEHQCYAVITATVETESTRNEYTGQAAMICPQNPIFATDPVVGAWNKSDLLVVELSLEKLHQSRQDNRQVYPVRDQLNRKQALTLTENHRQNKV